MSQRLRIGVLYSRVRVEEKWIFAALEQRGINYDRLDDRQILFNLDDPSCWKQYDAMLERSISFTSGLNALRILNAWGIPTVNTARVAAACGDKLATSAALAHAGLPQPRTLAAFCRRREDEEETTSRTRSASRTVGIATGSGRGFGRVTSPS